MRVFLFLLVLVDLSRAHGATATFDSIPEGLHGSVFADAGITFFDPHARSAGAPDAFAIDDVSLAFAQLPEFAATYSPSKVLGIGAFGEGPVVGGSAQFGDLSATRGLVDTYASVDVFYFGVKGFTTGNSIVLEGYRDGSLVAWDTVRLVASGEHHETLEIMADAFDTIRIAGDGPATNGVFFGAIDNVTMIPEPSMGILLFIAALIFLFRRAPQPSGN